MKNKYILLLVVICGLTIKIVAQPYSNYINYSSVWGMKSGSSDGVNNYVSHFRYYINGDTTIGTYNYFKLNVIGVDSIIPINSGSPSDTSFNYYIGALREDIAKKFYFIPKNQSSENILFDFNLTIGSSLPNNLGNQGCNSPQLVVQSLDSVYLGTTHLKRFQTNNTLVNRLIEGVGSEGGLIEQGSMCLGIEFNSYLLYYTKDADTLTIDPAGQNVVANYSVNAACEGTPICFKDSSTSKVGIIISRYWDFNDGELYCCSSNPCHLFANSGTYLVKLIVTNSNGITDTVINSVTVYAQPVANFSSSLNSNGATFTDLSTSANGTIDTWQWNFPNGNPSTSSQQNSPYITYPIGTYSACLKITSAYGCKDSVCNTIAITSVNENYVKGISNFSPNPFSEQTTLQTDKILKDATLTVYNSLGQQVKQIEHVLGQTVIFNRNDLPSGLYFIQLIENNQTLTNNKLIITNN